MPSSVPGSVSGSGSILECVSDCEWWCVSLRVHVRTCVCVRVRARVRVWVCATMCTPTQTEKHNLQARAIPCTKFSTNARRMLDWSIGWMMVCRALSLCRSVCLCACVPACLRAYACDDPPLSHTRDRARRISECAVLCLWLFCVQNQGRGRT